MKAYLFVCILFYIPQIIWSQLPASNLFQIEIKKDAANSLRLKNLKLLTSNNTLGYNNHPHVFGDSILFFSSASERQMNPDIFKLNLSNGKLVPFTSTPDGEYSAIVMTNQQNISILRMEFVGKDTLQRIWSIPILGQNKGKPLFKNKTNIGYFKWVSEQKVITFELGKPQTLWLRNLDSRGDLQIATLPGRCFQVLPNGDLYYLQKAKPGEPTFIYKTRANFTNESPKIPIIQPLNQQEDFDIFADGTLIMAEGAKIYFFHPDVNKQWELLADLSYYPIKKITRLEISKNENFLILVAQ